ncbi:response regulator transcription factor [Glycomyces tarimensis]
MIRVLLRHDPCLLGTALARALSFEAGIALVRRLGRSDDLITAGKRLEPDVVVLDAAEDSAETVAADCLAVCEGLPETNVLVMMCGKEPFVIPPDLARMAPRVGFITTDATCEQLTDAIRLLARGGAVIGSDVALATLRAKDNPLSTREREVLGMVVTGASTREIAGTLHLSVGTVRNYLSSAIGKTCARTRIDAIRIAQEQGWI